MQDIDYSWIPPGVVAGFCVVELVEDEDALELADRGVIYGGRRGMQCWRGEKAEVLGFPRANEKDHETVVVGTRGYS